MGKHHIHLTLAHHSIEIILIAKKSKEKLTIQFRNRADTSPVTMIQSADQLKNLIKVRAIRMYRIRANDQTTKETKLMKLLNKKGNVNAIHTVLKNLNLT